MRLFTVVCRSGTKEMPYYHACECWPSRERAQQELEKSYWNTEYYFDVQVVELDFKVSGETI